MSGQSGVWRVARSVWGFAVPLVLGVAAALLFHTFVAYAADVPTDSMSPTIPAPCYIAVDKLPTEFASLHRGEVVLFHFPDHPATIFVKRIIGLPGNTVKVTDHHVYINGRAISEPWAVLPNAHGFGTWHVPPGHYFMMGDNRAISYDSRFWKHPFVARAAIIGEAQFVLYPFSKWSVITQ